MSDRDRSFRRSRSRDRDRADRSRHSSSRDRGRSRDEDRGRDKHSRDRRSRSRDRDNRRPDDDDDRRARDHTRKAVAAVSGAKRAEDEKRERLAMVKRITGNDEGSDDEGKGGKDTGLEDMTEDDMFKLMGFTGFDSTKEKQVDSNTHSAAVGGAAKHKARQYRQYMNRRGGFNKALGKIN